MGPRPIRVAHAKVVSGWTAATHGSSAQNRTGHIHVRTPRSLRVDAERVSAILPARTEAPRAVPAPMPPPISARQYLASLEKEDRTQEAERHARSRNAPAAPAPAGSVPAIPSRQVTARSMADTGIGAVDPVNAWLLAHLRSGLWLAGVLAVAGVGMVAVLTRAARTAAEAAVVTPAWMTAFVPDGGADASPLASLQIGAYTQLTGAAARWESAIFAGREAMVFFTLLSVILLWLTARRFRLSVPASVAATAAFVIISIGVHPQSVVSADTVALPWALLALLLSLSSRRQIASFVLAGLALAVAMLTSAVFVVILPLVVWLMVRSTHAGQRLWPLVTGGLMLAAGVVASVLPVVLSGDAPFDRDTILSRLLTITIPLAAVVVAGAVDIGVARLRSTSPVRATTVGIVAVVASGVILAVPAWGLLSTGVTSETQSDPTIAAQGWIIDNVDPSQRVIVDEVMRADLLTAGWREPDVDVYRATSGELPADWREADVIVTHMRTDLLDDSVVVARFGEGSDAIEIRQVTSEGIAARTSAAVAAAADRRRAGSELAQNPRLLLADDVRAVLAEGRVDERIIFVLGALAADGDVTIDGFPVIEGEEGRTLRQVSLSRLQGEPLARDGRPSALGMRVVDALQGIFAPAGSSAEDDALVLRYPNDIDPLAP